MKKLRLVLVIFVFLATAGFCSAHLPRIVYTQKGDIKVQDPQTSQAFFDELQEQPRNYFVSSNEEFTLYINLLVPAINGNSKYSANIFKIKNGKEEKMATIDGQNFEWQEFYEEFGRDYYMKGPEFDEKLLAGDYKIEIFNYKNQGKYVLAVGKNEVFPIMEGIKSYWILPQLKVKFFQTPVWEFLFTPLGEVGVGVIGAILFVIVFFNYIISVINKILGRKPKMMLLTSSGMTGSKEDILAIIPKPPDDMLVAHIITASKPEEDKFYVQEDERLMREAGFNVEQIDIEGKNQAQLLYLLKKFDMVYVQGGNTFYLLKCMRACGFKKVMKKLFREGVIYVGVSAGSNVAGKSIETSGLRRPTEKFDMTNLKALNFIPFYIFVHYLPEHADIIKKLPRRIVKNLKILQDGQAMFILGSKITFVGVGKVINPNNL